MIHQILSHWSPKLRVTCCHSLVQAQRLESPQIRSFVCPSLVPKVDHGLERDQLVIEKSKLPKGIIHE